MRARERETLKCGEGEYGVRLVSPYLNLNYSCIAFLLLSPCRTSNCVCCTAYDTVDYKCADSVNELVSKTETSGLA